MGRQGGQICNMVSAAEGVILSAGSLGRVSSQIPDFIPQPRRRHVRCSPCLPPLTRQQCLGSQPSAEAAGCRSYSARHFGPASEDAWLLP